MQITSETKIFDIVKNHEFIIDFLSTISPRYKLLNNPLARNTVGKIATISQAASIGGLSAEELISKIAAEIERRTGARPETTLSENTPVAPITEPVAKHEMLKAIIRHLHDGGDLETAKRQFGELVKDVDASEIAAMEQKLISEGMPQEEVKRLCDVHVQVFKESIEVKDVPKVPESHPVYTFMAENRALERIIERIEDALRSVGAPVSLEKYKKYHASIEKLLDSVQKVNLHYLRKENQLFPMLERYGVTGPSQVMWSLDDDIRGMIKKCTVLHKAMDVNNLVPELHTTLQALRDMIFKEERILFPMAVDTLKENEWVEMRNGEKEIGYAWINVTGLQEAGAAKTASVPGVELDTGVLTQEQLNLMLTSLPVDISFVDENDTVKYYSAAKERIFPRSPAVIGRKVQNCHPPKSMGVVQKILDDFRSGTRSNAEFWINMQGKFIHIRYFAMRDANNVYKGCLEVSQDVTSIRKLDGESRLLSD